MVNMLSQCRINSNDIWQAPAMKGLTLTHVETCAIRDIAAREVNDGVWTQIERAVFAVVGAREQGQQPGLFDGKD